MTRAFVIGDPGGVLLTRWAFLAVDVNGPTMFSVHRPGCRDLRKADRIYPIGPDDDGPVVASADGPPIPLLANIIDRSFYAGDGYGVAATDVRRMPCLRFRR